jgi:anti-sigma B factor antagonist
MAVSCRVERGAAKLRRVTRGEPDGLRVPAVGAVDRRGDDVVLRLAGELDLYNSAEVAAALEELAADGPSRVIIDLSEVAFVDSTALGTLVEARRQIGGDGLVLVAPGPDVARALEISGLDQHFTVRGSVDEALAS